MASRWTPGALSHDFGGRGTCHPPHTVATMDEALAKLREVMPIATPAERRELAAILLGDVEIGAHRPHRRADLGPLVLRLAGRPRARS